MIPTMVSEKKTNKTTLNQKTNSAGT